MTPEPAGCLHSPWRPASRWKPGRTCSRGTAKRTTVDDTAVLFGQCLMAENSVTFEVIGSRGALYEVKFWLLKDGSFRSSCSCEGGYQLIHCVHRLEIAAGNYSAVTHDVPEVVRQFIETSLKQSETGRLLQE